MRKFEVGEIFEENVFGIPVKYRVVKVNPDGTAISELAINVVEPPITDVVEEIAKAKETANVEEVEVKVEVKEEPKAELKVKVAPKPVKAPAKKTVRKK